MKKIREIQKKLADLRDNEFESFINNLKKNGIDLTNTFDKNMLRAGFELKDEKNNGEIRIYIHPNFPDREFVKNDNSSSDYIGIRNDNGIYDSAHSIIQVFNILKNFFVS